MGKIKQGILGAVSGKVANIVGSSWKGISIIKSLPASVSNPNTAGQQAQRGAFGSAVEFAGLILADIIKPLWDRFASQMSGYNAFISANITCFDSTGLNNPNTLIISSGKMASTPIVGILAGVGAGVVDVTWTDDSGSGFKLATDETYVVCYDVTTKEVAVSSAVVTRADESASITFSASVTGHVVHAYLAFRRADGTIVSETAHGSNTI